MFRYRSKLAQIAIEYMLFLAIIVSVLIVFLGRRGPFDKSMRNILNSEANRVIKTGNKIFF